MFNLLIFMDIANIYSTRLLSSRSCLPSVLILRDTPTTLGRKLYISIGELDFLAITVTAQRAAGSHGGRRSRKQSVANSSKPSSTNASRGTIRSASRTRLSRMPGRQSGRRSFHGGRQVFVACADNSSSSGFSSWRLLIFERPSIPLHVCGAIAWWPCHCAGRVIPRPFCRAQFFWWRSCRPWSGCFRGAHGLPHEICLRAPAGRSRRALPCVQISRDFFCSCGRFHTSKRRPLSALWRWPGGGS
jgi:hypothetical protein